MPDITYMGEGVFVWCSLLLLGSAAFMWVCEKIKHHE